MTLSVQSKLLATAGVVHGFSTRIGGVSEGCFASLNLGRKWGDDPEKVNENHRRLAAHAGFAPGELTTVRQVHGSEVEKITASHATGALDRPRDALISNVAGRTIGIYTADCVPVLLADVASGWVGAVHAGWRGTVAQILSKTIAELVTAGVQPANLRLAIGPSIRSCCFEVDEDVAGHFAARDVVRAAGKKPHVDLQRANRKQAELAGVDLEHIDDVAICTCCNPQQFFSYRRDGKSSGQQLSFISGLQKRTQAREA